MPEYAIRAQFGHVSPAMMAIYRHVRKTALDDQRRQQSLLLGLARYRTDTRVDVGPVEASHHDMRLAKAEALDDVVADFRRDDRKIQEGLAAVCGFR